MKKTLTHLFVALMLCIGFNAVAQGEYITRWNLATSGTGPTQLMFKATTSGPVTYTWTTVPAGTTGTGTFNGPTATITGLPAGSIIRLSISPANLQWVSMYNAIGDSYRLVDIEQWGSTAWTSMQGSYKTCPNLQISATDVPNLSGVTDMSEMFLGCTGLNSPSNINTWNTSNVTNMGLLFSSAFSFNQNIGAWNTANVTSMNATFVNAKVFNQNIGTWNTAHVTTMANMFQGALAFNQSINSWNTANLTTTSSMFSGALAFNQSISSWNISNLAASSAMFMGATAFNQDMSAWNVSAITNMFNMFSGATAFNQSLAAWAPNLNPTVSMGRLLNNSGLSIANYDATLIAFNNLGPTGRTMDAISLKYCAAAAARANLVGSKGWTITGDAASGTIATPAFSAINAICSGNAITLPSTSSNSITGTWLPAINNTVTTTYTFSPGTGQCANTATITVTVTPNAAPLFASQNPICSGAALAALPATSSNSISGTWLPALNNTVSTTYTFSPNAGQCATTTTLDIVVNSTVTPAFTNPAAICSGAVLASLPATSSNSISGTWLPALNNTLSTTYTFTPNAGQCATTTTMAIAVNPNVSPAFTSPAAICSGAALSPLPLASTNGINGTWQPALDNTLSKTYTFTPNAGQCATTNTLAITVNANVAPAFVSPGAACSGAALSPLPVTSTNGITGTWQPAMNNLVSTTYTFTSNAGQCATSTATLAIPVNPNVTPAFTTVSNMCADASFTSLPIPSNNGVAGTWIPNIVYTNTTYTFVPNAGQCTTGAPVTMNVTVSLPPSAAFTVNGGTLTASQTGANYQWINCNGNTPIPNATAQNFTPTSNGSYAVTVTKNGCIATSTCQSMINVGIAEEEHNSGLVMYPNPTSGYFVINVSTSLPGTVFIHNALGELVYSNSITDHTLAVDLSSLASGIYVVTLSVNEKTSREKMVIGK